MKVLVLGGNGFIGSHIVNKLFLNGHYVHIFDQHKPHYKINFSNYTIGSLEDTDLVCSTLDDIDVVFHCISTTVPSTSNLDPIYDINTNLVSTIKLLDKLISKKNPPRIIYLSSGGTVYGESNSTTPLSENYPTNPICSYGIVKLAIEKYLYMYNRLHGLNYIILRLSNPYGLGQSNVGIQGVINTFINRAIHEEEINVWGDGDAVKDYIYIDDVSDACIKALEYNQCSIFNIGSGDGNSVNKILDLLQSISKKKLYIKNSEGERHDVKNFVLDNSYATEMLDWQPRISLEKGMKLMMESYSIEK